jgi:hypothetical protein
MVASSELENIVKPENKSQSGSLKHKLKALAVAVPLALMSYAPAAIAQEARTPLPEKKAVMSVVPYTDLRGTWGGSVRLGKLNDKTGLGFRAGIFVEPTKSQIVRFNEPGRILDFVDDYYWTNTSSKLSGGMTLDMLYGKPGRMLIGLGGGLGVESTESRSLLNDGWVHLDNYAQSSNDFTWIGSDDRIYSSGNKAKLFGRVQMSISFPLGKKFFVGVETGADMGRRPVYAIHDLFGIAVWDDIGYQAKPKHRNNLFLGINITYFLKDK